MLGALFRVNQAWWRFWLLPHKALGRSCAITRVRGAAGEEHQTGPATLSALTGEIGDEGQRTKESSALTQPTEDSATVFFLFLFTRLEARVAKRAESGDYEPPGAYRQGFLHNDTIAMGR